MTPELKRSRLTARTDSVWWIGCLPKALPNRLIVRCNLGFQIANRPCRTRPILNSLAYGSMTQLTRASRGLERPRCRRSPVREISPDSIAESRPCGLVEKSRGDAKDQRYTLARLRIAVELVRA